MTLGQPPPDCGCSAADRPRLAPLVARRLRRLRATTRRRHAQARRARRPQTIHNLIIPVFIIAGVVFVLVQGGVPVPRRQVPRRKDDDDFDDFPEQIHGNIKLEIGWTILPALILARRRRRSPSLTLFDLAEEPPTDAVQRQGHRPAVVVGVPLRRRRRRQVRRHHHRQRPRDPRRHADRACASRRATSSTRSGSRRSTARRTPCPAASHPLTHRGRRARRATSASAPSSAASPTPTCACRSWPSTQADFARLGRATSSRRRSSPPTGRDGRRGLEACFASQCTSCHQHQRA